MIDFVINSGIESEKKSLENQFFPISKSVIKVNMIIVQLWKFSWQLHLYSDIWTGHNAETKRKDENETSNENKRSFNWTTKMIVSLIDNLKDSVFLFHSLILDFFRFLCLSSSFEFTMILLCCAVCMCRAPKRRRKKEQDILAWQDHEGVNKKLYLLFLFLFPFN